MTEWWTLRPVNGAARSVRVRLVREAVDWGETNRDLRTVDVMAWRRSFRSADRFLAPDGRWWQVREVERDRQDSAWVRLVVFLEPETGAAAESSGGGGRAFSRAFGRGFA